MSNNEKNNVVTKVYPIEKKQGYRITLENGKTIICSDTHMFPTSEGLMSISTGLDIEKYLQYK
jgi:intein/homing endonuclease